jgi:predicted ATP-dependent serine protease
MKPPPTAYSVAGTGRSSHWRGQAASVKSWSTPEAWVTASMMLEPMPGVSSPTSAGAGDQRSMPVSSPDQIVLCDGKGVCCWPAHPRRTGATLCTHSDHRSLLLRGDAGVGKSTLIQRVSVKAAAQGWRVLLSTAVEAEASVIGRGERLQCGPGDRAERSADKDRGQFVVIEQSQSMAAIHPTAGHRPRSGEQNR